MPVDRSRIRSLVVDVDHNLVTFVAFDQRPWKGGVDEGHGAIYAVRVQFVFGDGPVILSCCWSSAEVP